MVQFKVCLEKSAEQEAKEITRELLKNYQELIFSCRSGTHRLRSKVMVVTCTTTSGGKPAFIVEEIQERFPCTKETCHRTGGWKGCMRCCRLKTRGRFTTTAKTTSTPPTSPMTTGKYIVCVLYSVRSKFLGGGGGWWMGRRVAVKDG